MLRRVFCAIFSIISINPFIGPPPTRTIKMSIENKIASIFVSQFIKKVEHYTLNEGVNNVHGDSFQVWDDPHMRKSKRIGWYAWVETDHKKYKEIGISLDVEMSLFHDYESAKGDVMNLIVHHVRDYFIHGITPAGADEYIKELNGN